MGPISCESGDEAWIIKGCNVPVVLRKTEPENDSYIVIGRTYVHGVMKAELQTKEPLNRIVLK